MVLTGVRVREQARGDAQEQAQGHAREQARGDAQEQAQGPPLLTLWPRWGSKSVAANTLFSAWRLFTWSLVLEEKEQHFLRAWPGGGVLSRGELEHSRLEPGAGAGRLTRIGASGEG